MRTYNIIVLISTAILIATVVTIIFAIAVYIISRTKRRKMREREESKSGATENIIITGSEFTKEYSTKDGEQQVGFVESGSREGAADILASHGLFVLSLA